MIAGSSQHNQLPLTAASSTHLVVVNTLFFPTVATVSLVVCCLFEGSEFSGGAFLLAVCTFLVTNLVVDLAALHAPSGHNARWTDLVNIIAEWIIVVTVMVAIMYLGGIGSVLSRGAFVCWSLITPITMWLAQRAVRHAFGQTTNDSSSRRAVIVGVTDVGLRLEGRLNSTPQLQTRVAGFFEERDLGRIPTCALPRVLGKPVSLAEYVISHNIQTVFITIPMSRQQRIVDMLETLKDSTASVYFVPDLFVFNLVQARIDNLGGIPLIAVCETPFYGIRAISKRLLDLCVAIVAITALSPLLLLVALVIKATSRGPIIFSQKRYGLDGQVIWIYKFRSMYVDNSGSYLQVTRGDPRVTRIGSFIRRTSIDEIPQLFNVLLGTMSIVGPRPHVIAVNEQYRRLIPGYMIRHKVRPGITGWAQVNGYRGGDDLQTMTKRIECDLEYLRHWSMGLDLRIIFRTIGVLLRDKAAY